VKLCMIGCSYQTSELAFREQIACTEPKVNHLLEAFSRRYPQCEAVLLSTCNRTEWYVACDDPAEFPDQNEITNWMSGAHAVSFDDFKRSTHSMLDRSVVEHLFQVACSLDSMVIGESQILAQVKHAYAVAAHCATAATTMHQLFQHALYVAKQVSNKTSIYQKRVSIPSVAIHDFASQIFESLADKSVLVFGAGDMAEESLVYLKQQGADNILVCNRNRERANRLAETMGGKVVQWDDRLTYLAQADMLVSATSASEPVITLKQYKQIETKRLQRPLFILDLAIPRDIDPEINRCLNVYLYSIDDLREQCEINRKQRESEMPKAQQIIALETDRYFADLNRRTSGPTIKRLRDQAQQTRDAELIRLLNRLGPLLDQQCKDIEIAFDRLVNKILHPPLESIRDQSKSGSVHSMVDALKRLFQLSD
jgi:glutamyl-tRNA reductase